MIFGTDPLRDFGFNAETAIRPVRANIIALNEMMNSSDLSEPDVQEAFGFIIVDCYVRLDKFLEAYGAALEAVREARAA